MAPPKPFEPPFNEYEDWPEQNDPKTAAGAFDQRDDDAIDSTPDATDPQAQVRAIQKKKFKDHQYKDFWKRVLDDPVGRRAVWDWLSGCGTFDNRFACSPAGFPDKEATWFYTGQKHSGERLYQTLMRFDFEGLNQMFLEYHPDFTPPPPVKRRKQQ